MITKSLWAVVTMTMAMAVSGLMLPAEGFAQDEESTETDLASAIARGEASLGFRYRYEFVDQDGFDENANASTMRVRLNYETRDWREWTGLLEFDYVFELLLDEFNSGGGTSSPDRDQYPVVADPNGPDLNQLYLQFAPDNWRTRLGRQRILLDDQRFVGGVGWRQNEQTYDSASFRYKGFADTTVFYSYVGNVNRIFGRESAVGQHKQNTHLLNANVKLSDAWTVVGYAYLIDNDDLASFSTDTIGFRVNGKLEFGDDSVALIGEFATQSDAGDNPASFDVDYFRLQAIWTGGPFSAGLGYESLGSDNGQGFRTPLATLHAFNGWADKFLATPPDGLNDFYVRFGYKWSKWNFQARYHDFSAETGSADFGSEIDLSAGRPISDRYGVLFKLAAYDADDPPYTDTTKVWIMLTAAF